MGNTSINFVYETTIIMFLFVVSIEPLVYRVQHSTLSILRFVLGIYCFKSIMYVLNYLPYNFLLQLFIVSVVQSTDCTEYSWYYSACMVHFYVTIHTVSKLNFLFCNTQKLYPLFSH